VSKIFSKTVLAVLAAVSLALPGFGGAEYTATKTLSGHVRSVISACLNRCFAARMCLHLAIVCRAKSAG